MGITRPLLVSVLLGTMVLTGFGCKGSVTADQVQSTKRITLEYWTVFDDVDALQATIRTFQADRPFISVNVRQIRQEELYNRLVEALAIDKGPDVISISNRSLGTYLNKLAPMPASVKDTTQYVQQGQINDTTVINTKTKPTVTVEQLAKEYAGVVAIDAVREGKIYGLPLSLDTMAIYYNKDLLDRAGIATAPKTWEEFQVDVRKLTKYDKTTGKIVQSGAALGTGTNVPWNDDLLYVLYKQSNVPFVDKAGRSVLNNRPNNSPAESPAMSVVNFYTDFANPTRDTYTWNDSMPNALDAFVNGQLAFFFGYSFNTPIIKSRAPQLNYDIMPMLQLNPEFPADAANYSLQAVTAKSKNQNDAWNLVTYLTHSSANKTYLDRSGRPTALRAYLATQQTNSALAPFVSNLLVAGNWYLGANYDAASKAIDTLVTTWLLPAPEPSQEVQYRQGQLDRAAQTINQTF